MAYPDLKFFIDGKWKTRDDGEPVINPSDGSVITTLPHVTRADLDDALAAAQKGFEVWRKTPAIEREKIMLRAAEIIEKRREDIVAAIMLDQGKTRAEADAEVTTAHDRIIWDATEGRRLYGRIIPGRPGLREMVMRFPVGVVAAFTPWNYPLASPTRKVAGALAVGCSIILKGAEETPAGPMMLVQAFADAGVPDGVVRISHSASHCAVDHVHRFGAGGPASGVAGR
jgi:succinate-semialdehyde dehydrogenase/glutarate-semialdehyde dehydrogenase